MPKSLQGRLSLLFLSLALLVLIAVAAMAWGLQTQRQDAVVISLAGRQTILAEQMVQLADGVGRGEMLNSAALNELEQQFNQTQAALRNGGIISYLPGTTVNLPPTRDPQILSALDQVDATWSETRTRLDELQRTSPTEAASALRLQSTEEMFSTLVDQSNTVVHLYETDAAAKFNRLRALQYGVLASAVVLLAAGMLITRGSVIKPLRELGNSAARLGENDLDTAITVDGPEEIAALSRSFERMRLNLQSSHEELRQLNSSLEEHIARRTRELELLNDISREISSHLDIQRVLNSVTEKAHSLLAGEVAALCLMDENQHWLRLQAISGPRMAVNGQNAPADDALAGVVLERDQALVCGAHSCHGECRILSPAYRVSHMAAPLRTGDHVIGALCVGSVAQDRFAEDSAALLTKLANSAAIALENARLYAQAERVATLEERHRVAAEMHDGLGQTLSYLGLMTDQVVEFLSTGQDDSALGRLAKAREAIGQASGELRRAINSLMDESPGETDLCKGLQIAVKKFAADSHLLVTWQAAAGTRPKCSRQTAEQVMNIASEALSNVAHHAQARHVRVRIGQVDGHYSLTVEDDGKGFDTSQPEPTGHFGLQIMQTRAAHIGGRVQIDSKPEKGTRVLLTWPMETNG